MPGVPARESSNARRGNGKRDFTAIRCRTHVFAAGQLAAALPVPLPLTAYPCHPSTANTVVTASVDAMWHAGPDVVPTPLGAHPAVDALRDGMSADAFDLDNNFTGWKREAVIAWTDEHRKLTLTADGTFGQMVVFAPVGEALLCVEPVSNTTGCFNLPADARENVGGCVLESGQSITGVLHWTPVRY